MNKKKPPFQGTHKNSIPPAKKKGGRDDLKQKKFIKNKMVKEANNKCPR